MAIVLLALLLDTFAKPPTPPPPPVLLPVMLNPASGKHLDSPTWAGQRRQAGGIGTVEHRCTAAKEMRDEGSRTRAGKQ